MQMLSRFLYGSITRAIFLSLLVVSVVPIGIVVVLFIQRSSEALTDAELRNLQAVAVGRATEINLRLKYIQDETQIAAQYAASVLEQPAHDAMLTGTVITRYKSDKRNIIGLDEYYRAAGGSRALGTNLSNVYWNGTLDQQAATQIAQTESLDRVFAGIKATSPDSQWIYLSTKEGMMRLYPWASNDQYPDKWDPRDVMFYTVADPAHNPSLQGRWTRPYVDFAGAGWMVTYSVPVTDSHGKFLGIMSHDITIGTLKRLALDSRGLNDAGYGFLVESDGGVIAHPRYGQDATAGKGSQDKVNLMQTGSQQFRQVIKDMLSQQAGVAQFTDERGKGQLLVYNHIGAIDWGLGDVVPYDEVIRPAMDMRNRALTVVAIVIVIVVLLSLVLTRGITRPLRQLLKGVNQVRDEEQADSLKLNSFVEINELSGAFNTMADIVRQREQHLKLQVRELKIQIDSQANRDQINSIIETDYFKHLEVNAERLRQKVRMKTSRSVVPTVGR